MEQQTREALARKLRRPGCCSGPVLRFFGAVVCIALTVTSWVLQAESLQGLFINYNKPYFLVFWVHCWYSILYVVWQGWKLFPGNFHCNAVGDGLLSWKRAAVASGILGSVGLVVAYTWYISLLHTSVSANTAIYQSSIAFVFILSVPILRERVTVLKVIAMLFAVSGVILISIFSEQDQSTTETITETPAGYIALVVSTLLYALWEVLYKKIATVKDDPAALPNGIRIIGLMGVHTFIWMWPPLIILNFWAERFEWPSPYVLQLMFLNAFLDLMLNIGILLAISLSSPVFASVGTVTAMPLSILVDLFINGRVSPFLVYLGMALIGIGFVGFCISEFVAARKESAMEKKLAHRQATVSESSYLKPHTSSPPHLPTNAYKEEEEESQPLLDTPPRKKWKDRVMKYML